MTKQKLKLITDFVNEKLDGEIYELKFGCRVMHDDRERHVLIEWDGMENHLAGGEDVQTYCDTLYMFEIEPQTFDFDEEISYVTTGRWEYGSAPNPIKNQIEILGRPVTLEDVLNVQRIIAAENDLRNNTTTYTISWFSTKLEKTAAAIWSYGKPLSEQEESLLDFLITLFNLK